MASRIMTETVTVTTTGSAGSATGIASTDAINGFLLDVFLDLHDDAPATTDVIITYGTPGNGAVITRSDSAQDVLLSPRLNPVDATGAAISGVYDYYPVDGTLDVNVQGCDALAPALTARIRYLRPF